MLNKPRFRNMKSLLLIFTCISLKTAQSDAASKWNDLRVTFGLNLFNSWNFDSLPRDLSGSRQEFELKDDQCASGNGTFLGKRYWYKNDPATVILFDVNGYVAGIQTSIPKSSNWHPSRKVLGRYVLEDGDYYTLTAYFVEPSTICRGGRSAEQFSSQGTGTALYIQTGPKPLNGDVFKVPQSEADIKKTIWGNDKCFYLMGQHYWYNVSKDMSCDNFVPYCLLYNKGNLNAFCFVMNHNIEPSKRYEHPTPKAAAGTMKVVPDCVKSEPTFQTMSSQHVYLTSNYMANMC